MIPSRTLILPASGDASKTETFEDVASLVIIGANGSGKSRMGAWIEDHPPAGRRTHRVSAQRSLRLLDNVTPRALEPAENLLYYGNETNINSKQTFRWGQRPTGHTLNDYDALLSLLYARERERNSQVIEQIRGGQQHSADSIPPSDLETIRRIWAEIFPHRELLISKDAVRAQTPGQEPYSGTEMSDGERVAIYLMGESLCAPKGAILVVDEPEIHLHQAVQARLWDRIETARPDCTFVYITHDLHFAAGRPYDFRISVEAYDGKNWQWTPLPDDVEVPSPLALRILGSRQPILFVEGDGESVDRIYRLFYPRFQIAPRGGCEEVINAVRASKESGSLHKRAAVGLIDRDRRSEEELVALATHGVYSCPLAEVESFFCLPEVLTAAAEMMGAPERSKLAENLILREFRADIERQVVAVTCRTVKSYASKFNERRGWTREELISEFSGYITRIDVGELYDEEHGRMLEMVESTDCVAVLRVFKRKGLANQVAQVLGFKPDAYKTWLFGVLECERQNGKSDGLLSAIKRYLPTLPGE